MPWRGPPVFPFCPSSSWSPGSLSPPPPLYPVAVVSHARRGGRARAFSRRTCRHSLCRHRCIDLIVVGCSSSRAMIPWLIHLFQTSVSAVVARRSIASAWSDGRAAMSLEREMWAQIPRDFAPRRAASGVIGHRDDGMREGPCAAQCLRPRRR
ncbi:hypothetical protein DENSPDRAFT_579583 [Dentipellis sp. KUC8613]|nr:hypothetical protein DENSPDRAFT_579583 [Dentipellis sp. KUC8613]